MLVVILSVRPGCESVCKHSVWVLPSARRDDSVSKVCKNGGRVLKGMCEFHERAANSKLT